MGSTYYWSFSLFHYALFFLGGGIFSPKYLGLGMFQISNFFSNYEHDDTNSNWLLSLGQRPEIQNTLKGIGLRTASSVNLQFLPSNQFETGSSFFFFSYAVSFQFSMSASHMPVVTKCSKDLGCI